MTGRSSFKLDNASPIKVLVIVLFTVACLAGIEATSGAPFWDKSQVEHARGRSNALALRDKTLAAVKANGGRFPAEFRRTEHLARFLGLSADDKVFIGTDVQHKSRFVPNPWLAGMKVSEVRKPELVWMIMERPGKKTGWRFVINVDGSFMTF